MAEKTPEEIAAEKAAAEQAAADAAAADKAAKEEATRLKEEKKILVRMTKSGDFIDVHPTCVANHEQLGWIVKS